MPNPVLLWLDRVPIEDVVDRRNARVIQVLLIFLAVTMPAMIAFSLVVTWSTLTQGPLPVALIVSIVFGLAFALVAGVGVWMIRRGQFRPAVRAIIGMELTMLFVNASANGFDRQLPDQLAQMLVLILSGLVLGRKSLWTVFCALLAVVAVGSIHDAMMLFAETPLRALYNLPSTLFSYFLVAILIDRTTEALRESLRESSARGEALEQEIHEREQTHKQLVHAQKKEIIERMASGMAHDFNNIFSVIAGFSAERHEDDGGTDAQRASQLESSLESVEESARRGMAISRRLLRFSRLDDAQAQVFDAGEAIDTLQPMLRQLLDTHIVLTCTREETQLPILFDRSQFELMLLNLASNARDAIGVDGRFSINTRRERGDVVIVLQDDGAGMPAAVTTRVFEPFFSTKPADSGTGLGLAVVQDLVTKAGGTIGVKSMLGTGTTFRIALPLREAE